MTIGFSVTMTAVAALMLWSMPTVNDTEDNVLSVDVGVEEDAEDGGSVVRRVTQRTVQWEPTVWWSVISGGGNSATTSRIRSTWRLSGRSETPKPSRPPISSPSGQMVIPTGEEIELIVTSRDVIHSFWIPALNGKRDAVPNRFSPWKIEALRTGLLLRAVH